MKKLLVTLAIVLGFGAVAQAQTTPIQILDTIYNPDGSKPTGTIYISNPAFFDSTNHLVTANSIQTNVTNGNVNVSLVPTVNAITPGIFYSVRYSMANGPPQGSTQEFWAVPATGPTTLATVRVAPFLGFPGAHGVLTINGDATVAQTLTTTNDTNVTLGITNNGTGGHVLTPGWTGTLAATRLNSNVVQGVTNDTNVTGVISAQVLSLGWTGVLSVPRGGMGQASYTNNGILLGQGSGPIVSLAPVADAIPLWPTSGSISQVVIPNCPNDGVHGLIYSTSTHQFTCAALSGGGGGSVNTTGSPASGNLAKFSGALSITNGDLTGDVSTAGTLATTLATVVSPGSCGDATHSCSLTIDAKGRITVQSNVNISAAAGSTFQVDGVGLISSGTINFQDSNAFNGLTATFANPSAGNVKLGFTGALTSAGLSTTGVTAATYGDATHVGQFTVDAAGRITAASNVAVTGGGGVGMAYQLTDVAVTKTSGTVETMCATCSGSAPANIRSGLVNFQLTTSPTVTISGTSASGNVYWYLTANQQLTVGHNTAAVLTCAAGCVVATSITGFPTDSVPLWQTSFSSNVWDAISVATMDKRAVYSRDIIQAGAGLASADDPTTGIRTLATDPLSVPRYSTASGTPSANCTTGRDFYTDSSGLALYFCDAPNTWKQAGGSSAPVFNQTTLNEFDDFLDHVGSGACNLGKLGWCFGGGGGGGSAALSSALGNGHPGNIEVFSATTSADTDYLQLANNNSGPTYDLYLGSTAAVTSWESRFTILTDTRAGSVSQVAYEFGFKDSQTYRSGNSISFRYDPTSRSCTTGTNSTTNWMLEVFAAGSSTCVDTGVAVADSTWYTFDLSSSSLGTISAMVSTNGGSFSSPVTSATHVPTAVVQPSFLLLTEAALGSRLNFVIDYWQIYFTGLTHR